MTARAILYLINNEMTILRLYRSHYHYHWLVTDEWWVVSDDNCEPKSKHNNWIFLLWILCGHSRWRFVSDVWSILRVWLKFCEQQWTVIHSRPTDVIYLIWFVNEWEADKKKRKDKRKEDYYRSLMSARRLFTQICATLMQAYISSRLFVASVLYVILFHHWHFVCTTSIFSFPLISFIAKRTTEKLTHIAQLCNTHKYANA